MSCIFCKIVNKEIASNIVYEDEKVVAFHDINPQAPYHILVVPKKHISTLLEVTEEDKELIGHIYLVINKIAKDIGFDERGYRVVVNCKEEAGQTIFHLHFHVLAGRTMGWPPG
ncbi:histidine triad (HIT) protein [Thermodesulfobacterium geofontis OPF15]|jgi:histidine triad (HIT) family protein|uniref:Histidine triad (HIT) protein n=1 Tax=Thermodesulfobacterium geofontis (strain OPF15) TaxID=795359 RepID=F8C1V0_THEGP|nr:histidine triad nucleotide-binding protein [Thermodesulfobacterium geofontis]AEH23273.1 histidine triad (HIT) protein [Thermodesulfobacterium geofontis OPF15]